MFSADVAAHRGSDGRLNVKQVGSSAADIEALGAIDLGALGLSREKHHRHLLSDPTMRGFLMSEGNSPIGYAYVASTGHVGPLAVARSDAMGPAFNTAVTLAGSSNSRQISAFLPGSCDPALSIAAERGMRITLPMVLVSNRDFGDWRCYLPRNPGFM